MRPGAFSRHALPSSMRLSSSRRRVMFLTVVDQGASSISNFALAVVVAHYSDAHVLGIFAVLTTTYIVSQVLVRSLTSDCLLTRHESDDGVMDRYERAGFLTAILCSAAVSVALLVISAVMSPEFRLMFVIFAVSFPLMACQDFARYIGISRYNPLYAVWLDAAWLVFFIVAYLVLRHAGLVSLPWLFGGWTGAGAAVGLFALWNHLSPRRTRAQLAFWYESERSVGFRFAGQTLLVTSWTYLVVYLLVLLFSVAVIGQFKLAQLAFGPVAVMGTGILTAMIALAAKAFHADKRRALHFVLLGGLVTASLTLVWLAVVYALPVAAMTKLLGPTWPQARRLVPLVGLSFALSYLPGAAASGLRSIRAARENLQLALYMVPVLLLSCMTGAVLWGVQGAAGGLCAGFVIYAVVGWTMLIRAVRRFEADSPTIEPVLEVAEP
jgi:O-antigen/teichoic acid export membrane protein